jgi:hypothetical protein
MLDFHQGQKWGNVFSGGIEQHEAAIIALTCKIG